MFFRKKKPEGVAAPDPARPAFDRIRDAVLADALARNADAIRIAPQADVIAVAHRIGGEWQDAASIPAGFGRRLADSFRRACDLPASGGFVLGLFILERGDSAFDAYTAFLPARYGVRIAVRLLPHTDDPTDFRPEEMLTLF